MLHLKKKKPQGLKTETNTNHTQSQLLSQKVENNSRETEQTKKLCHSRALPQRSFKPEPAIVIHNCLAKGKHVHLKLNELGSREQTVKGLEG